MFTMTDYFIALLPDSEFSDSIIEAKNKILMLFGEQTYLKDPPHMTLVVSSTKDINGLKKEFGKLSKKYKKIYMEIRDFVSFPPDSASSKTPLGLGIEEDYIEDLRNVQSDILNLSAKFRSGTPSRYKELNFSGEEKKNLDLYGFPYAGKIWIPHISFCVMDSKKIVEAKKIIGIKGFMKRHSLVALGLYELRKDNPIEIMRVELK